MLKIGLTGGMGSGKTTVAHIFEVLGIPVYFADDEAKKLMHLNEGIKQQIIDKFGNESYINGELNRPYLSKTVFGDEQKVAQLNAIVHPATIAAANSWMTKQTSVYAIKEAALIFEANAQQYVDVVIAVYAPQSIRVNRVMQRDNLTEQEVLSRMQKQMNDYEKMKLADFVIYNDNVKLLIPQVLALHNQFISHTDV